jgi:DNA-binding MarR family transcriptional regulator
MTSPKEEQFLSLLLRLHHSGPGYPPFEQSGVTPAQFAYLDCLHRTPHSTLQELADQLQLTPASASNAIKQLEQSGLVLRAANQDDGRSYLFSLSLQGITVHAQIADYRRHKAHELLARLDEEEQGLFLRLFQQLLTPAS